MASREPDRSGTSPDMSVVVGSVCMDYPVLTASGTSGHGAELSESIDLSRLGAVVVKSLAHFPWRGNEPIRVTPVDAGMLNSVGLAGPGVTAWVANDLPGVAQSGARCVVSLWGRSVDDYAVAARNLEDGLASAPGSASCLIAVEVNVSCPNLHDGQRMFAHSAEATANVVKAMREVTSLPLWIKLSPTTPEIVAVAKSAIAAGGDALTLVNTVVGMAIDISERRAVLGGVTGGLSGPALHPVAVRCVYECRAALPDVPIIGVGGISTGEHAVEMMMAGANAIQVGTATFANPRAPLVVGQGIEAWCREHSVSSVSELTSAAHANSVSIAFDS